MKITRLLLPLFFGIVMVSGLLLGARGQSTADDQPILRFVSTIGSDTTDCTDSANPCATVQYAVDRANAGDEIRVASGVYTGVNNIGGRSQLVYISKTITIQGGYTTINWTVSNPYTNLTTLDAKKQGRVVYITGAISPTVEGLKITGGYSGSSG